MADIRIKDLPTTASLTASGDFIAIDGTSNGTRKLNAATPAFLTSVTTPSLTSPAATALTLGTTDSGAAITVLAASNNVGIGTVSPSAPLHIAGSSGSGQIRVATDSAGTYAGGFGLNASTSQILSGSAAGSLDIWAGGTGDIHFGPAAVTAMTLKSGGNVGIGTPSPSSQLTIYGSAGISVGVDDDNRAAFGYSAGRFYFGTRVASVNYFDALNLISGNVLIGTTSDTGLTGSGGLKINSSTAASANAGALVLQGGISAGNTGSAASYFGGAVTAAGAIKSTSTYGFSVGDGGAGNARMLFGADGAGIYSLLNASNAYANFNTGPIAVTGALSTTGAATFAGAVAIANTVSSVSPTSPNRTITMVVGGVTLYIAAKTTND